MQLDEISYKLSITDTIFLANAKISKFIFIVLSQIILSICKRNNK